MFHHHLAAGLNGGVGVAFTDRHDADGTLTLGRGDHGEPGVVAEGFEHVRAALGVAHVATARQVHGIAVHRVRAATDWPAGAELGDAGPGGRPLPEADALVTDQPGVALCIRVADCVPVVLADARARAVGAAHAGRVGLAAGVLQATLGAMRELGAGDITAWIGPRICGGCYEVPYAMAADVSARVPGVAALSHDGTPALDLGAGAALLLRGEGVSVHDVGSCTKESPQLHSYRRDAGESGRLGAFVWMV